VRDGGAEHRRDLLHLRTREPRRGQFFGERDFEDVLDQVIAMVAALSTPSYALTRFD
jgi:hypothetical protein